MHSRFLIPFDTNDSTCNIKQGSDLAKLIIRTKLIVWDKAPMTNKFCFEALDKTLRDVLRFSDHKSLEQPFGRKVIVFGEDFRQILPVIPKGSRQDIILATINFSFLWNFCNVLTLTKKNMRFQKGFSSLDLNELREFLEWILKIRDSKLDEPNDGEYCVEIPDEFLIKDTSDPLAAIVESTYPSWLQHS